jgi:WD40 repeat protein
MTMRFIFVWLFLLLAPSASAAQTWRMTQSFAPADLGGGPLAVSPNGTRLATVDTSGQYGVRDVLLWDMAGHLVRRLNAGSQEFMAFSPDVRWLVTSSGAEEFSRDGKGLLMAGGAETQIWDTATGKNVLDLPIDPANSSARVVLWDTQSRKLLWIVPLPDTVENESWDDTAALRFSPDERMVAVGSAGGGLLLYDAASGHLIRSFTSRGPNPSGIGIMHGVLFSGDGRLLIGAGGSGTIREWNVATGAPVASLATPGVQGLTPLPGGRTFLAMVGRDIDVVSVDGLHILKRLRGHDEDVTALALAPDGRTLWSAAGDATVKRWNLQTGVCAVTYGRIQQAVLSPDGKTLAYSLGDTTVTLRDLETGRTRTTRTGFARPQREKGGGYNNNVDKTLAFSPNGRMLAGGAYTTVGFIDHSGVFHSRVVVWDVRKARVIHDWEGDPAAQIAFSPGSRRIALMSPSLSDTPPRIRVRALPSGRIMEQWNPLAGKMPPYDGEALEMDQTGITLYGAVLGFTAGGEARLAATNMISDTIREPAIWDVRTRRRIRSFDGGGAPDEMALSSDGSRLATLTYGGSFLKIRVWNTATEALCSSVIVQAAYPAALFFGGDKWVAVADQSDTKIWLISATSGRPPLRLDGTIGGVASLSFSADGRVLASVSANGTVRVWTDEPTK